jgi:MFS family permease
MPENSDMESHMRKNTENRALVAAAMAHFINDGNSVTFAILIIYYSSIGMSLGFLGAIASFYLLISGIVSERIGYLADTSGRRGLIMSIGIVSLGFSLLLFSLSFYFIHVSVFFLVLGALFLGIGLSIYHPLGGSIIAYATQNINSAKHMGINGSFGSLGRAVFPTIIIYLVTAFGLVEGLLVFSGITLAFGLAILSMTRGFDMGMVKHKSVRDRSVLLHPYRRFIIVLTILFFLSALYTQGVTTFIPKYLETQYNSKQLAGLATSITYATPVAGQVILGTLTDKLGGRRILYLTTVMSAAVFAGFFVTHYAAAKVAVLGLFAFFVYSGFPVVLGYAQQVVPREVAARLNGIVWGLGNTLGGALGAALAGLMVDHYGFTISFFGSWLFGLLAVAFLPMIPRREFTGSRH